MRRSHPCGFGIATGQLIGAGLPMLEAVREGLSKAVSAGLGEKDWSIMADMTVRGGDSVASSENNSEKK